MSDGHRGLVGAWYRGAWWLWLLRPFEFLFRSVAAGRRSLYRSGVLRVYRPEKPLVVVGNITVGGTGKTPVVIALVEALQAAGLRWQHGRRLWRRTPVDLPAHRVSLRGVSIAARRGEGAAGCQPGRYRPQ